MNPDAGDVVDRASARAEFRGTLVRVLAVQAVALLVLWVLHARYALAG